MEQNTNTLTLVGSVVDKKVAYTNEKYHETFYELDIEVTRRSNNTDTLPVIVSEKLMLDKEIEKKTLVTVEGQIRTRNVRDEEGHNHLSIFGYAQNITVITLADYAKVDDKNVIELDGHLCKEPRCRKTSNTGRVITDLIVAVNRKYNRSDYLPVIAWGRNAYMAANFHVGDEVKLRGRFQSRTYSKRSENGAVHTVYEVSVLDIQYVDPEPQDAASEAAIDAA